MPTELSFKPLGAQVKERVGLERVADVDPRLTRSHYFDSRLLTAEDLNRDQIYLDGRLREVGQALGYGVLRGLDIGLDDGVITVTPGVGVSRAGRVLELTRELNVNIGERADISELNGGRYRRIDRALYAVVIKYSEQGTDVAEVFPTDLGEKRSFSYDVITEGVQLLLVRLPQPLSQQNAIAIRANLLREWLHDNTAGGGVPEDGVALGVLAISGDKALWLDSELLRQPLRAYDKPGDVQLDLNRRYDNLFDELTNERALASLNNDFAVTDYFRLIPPVGKLAKDAIDPVSGRQGFFPENFNIWIAPVRLSDVELIRAESMSLPPIDLSSGEPIDIIVMVPLANADYGKHAQRLERPGSSANPVLPAQNLLRLRLFPQVPVHELDTDKNEWQSIWNKVAGEGIFYIRRPLRAAETRLSGIVLAQGVPVPPNAPALPPSPADLGLLLDADGAFLNVLNLEQLYALRLPLGDAGEEVGTFFMRDSGTDVVLTQYAYKVMALVDRKYDTVIWQTIAQLAYANDNHGGTLNELVALLSAPENQRKPIAPLIVAAADELRLSDDLKAQWQAFGEA